MMNTHPHSPGTKMILTSWLYNLKRKKDKNQEKNIDRCGMKDETEDGCITD